MNINRSNYEYYFLLYVDGELSAVEIQMVNRFASENKDLADELNTLLQIKLPVEDIMIFENKSALLKTTSQRINHINYEEKFLLLIDNELTDLEKEETLDFISSHLAYQKEFETIIQTKLPIENIGFPYKESLYRNLEKSKPIIIMHWWKLAVAAAFFGIILMIGISISNKNFSSVAKLENKIMPTQLNEKSPIQSIVPKDKIKTQPLLTQNKTATINQSFSIHITKRISDQPLSNKHLIAEAEKLTHIENQETINFKTSTIIPSNYLPPINNVLKTYESEIAATKNQPKEAIEPTNYAKSTLYKELDTDDERKSLYLGAVEINKDKLRGFLRKASSLFKSRNRDEAEKDDLSNSHILE